ncbi:energy-coupling factor transporter transmembrane protein EcfT [Firmicutes bacterium AM55-24TS]|nr:energy-coupling factor transporter transmembrane protein EcfT [Firmicutes bacterium AM55-24TS]
MNEFAKYHPLINFIYFTAVIVFSMIFVHPICLVTSLLCSVMYSIILNGKKTMKFIAMLLPLMLISALINPAFNHEGVTVIAYLPSGNPLTLESILYGIVAASMVATVICWFSCFNKIMTSDKFIYLFGRIIPSLSLILSMTFRFVPKFKEQVQEVSNAQKSMGRDSSEGSVFARVKNSIRILSAVITWSLENAIDTSDSMKSRGYGLTGRTAYSNYVFDKRDVTALIYLAVTITYFLIGVLLGKINYRYFPSMRGTDMSFYSTSIFISYIMICIMPIIIEIWEELKWRKLKSKI